MWVCVCFIFSVSVPVSQTWGKVMPVCQLPKHTPYWNTPPPKYLTLQTHTHTFTSQAGGHTVKPQPRLRPGDGLLSMWLEGTPALECVQILLLIPVCQLCFNLRPRGPLAFTAPLGVRMMAVHDCTSTSGIFNKLSFRTGFGPQILRVFFHYYFFFLWFS